MSRLLLAVALVCAFAVASVAADAQCYQSCLSTYQATVAACSPSDAQCYVNASEQYTACSSKCTPSAGKHHIVFPIASHTSINPQCYQSCYSTYMSAVQACASGDAQCYSNAAAAYGQCTSACGGIEAVTKTHASSKVDPQCYSNCYSTYQAAVSSCTTTACIVTAGQAYTSCCAGCQSKRAAKKAVKNPFAKVDPQCYQNCYSAYMSASAGCTTPQCYQTAGQAYSACCAGCAGEKKVAAPVAHKLKKKHTMVKDQQCYTNCYNTYLSAVQACGGNSQCYVTAGQAYVACQATCQPGQAKKTHAKVDPQCYSNCYSTYQAAVSSCTTTACIVTAGQAYTSCCAGCQSVKKSASYPHFKVADPAQCDQTCYNSYETTVEACTTSQCYTDATNTYQACVEECSDAKKTHAKVDPQCYTNCYTAYTTASQGCTNAACYQAASSAYQTCVAGCAAKKSIMQKKHVKKDDPECGTRGCKKSAKKSAKFANPACYQSCFNTYQSSVAACAGSTTCLVSAGQAYVACQATC